MLTLDFNGSAFVLTGDTPLDRDVATTIQAVKASGAQRWLIKPSIPAAIDARICVEQDGGTLTPAFSAWLSDACFWVESYLLPLKNESNYVPTQFGEFTLRPDQEADAVFLAAIGNGGALHVPRLGKTNVVLRAIDKLGAFPAFIAAKDSLVLEMAEQVRQAFPDRPIVAVTSGLTASQRRKLLQQPADVYILGKKNLENHVKLVTYGGIFKKDKTGTSLHEREVAAGKYEPKELDAITFKAVVIDEAHSIQVPKNAITRAAWSLGDRAEHRFILTATPAANHEDEWWAPLRFCYPHLFPSKAKFLNRWVNMVHNFFGIEVPRGFNKANLNDFTFIRDLMSVSRVRTGGAIKEYREIPVELTSKQMKTYRDLEKHGMASDGDETVIVTDNMSLGHRLRNVAAGTPIIENGDVKSIALPSPKIEALIDLFDERRVKTVIVAESRLTCDLVRYALPERGITTVSVIGGMKPQEIQAAKERFQNGDADAIVINSAGSEGLELSAAVRTVFLERSRSLVFNVQAEDRNMSYAQESDVVEVIDIYAKGTRDEADIADWKRKLNKMNKDLGRD